MTKCGVVTPRRAGRASVVFFIMCALAVLLAGKVQAMELSGGVQEATPEGFSTQLPQPQDYSDNCARYLNEYNGNQTGVPSERNPDMADQGVSLVIGLRVAFGTGQAHSSSHVSFNLWQPTDAHDPTTLAAADYRSCEGNRAMGINGI
jgi:hypothetical protein